VTIRKFKKNEKRGGCHEGEEQGNKGNQESTPVEPERKKKVEKGKEK
jgi:hypothetical protein